MIILSLASSELTWPLKCRCSIGDAMEIPDIMHGACYSAMFVQQTVFLSITYLIFIYFVMLLLAVPPANEGL